MNDMAGSHTHLLFWHLDLVFNLSCVGFFISPLGHRQAGHISNKKRPLLVWFLVIVCVSLPPKHALRQDLGPFGLFGRLIPCNLERE